MITEQYLTDTADGIRAKLGVQTEYKPSEFKGAILSIPTGTTPSGTIDITENGTVDVTDYASANVQVQSGASPSNDSLLRNWDFTNPVNTRGNTQYTNGYTINGWATSGATLELGNDGITYTSSGSSANWYSSLIITLNDISNKQFTLSCLVDGVLYSKTFTMRTNSGSACSLSITNGLSFNCNIDSTYAMACYFWAGNAGSWLLQAAKLEQGSQQTLAHQEGNTWVLNKHRDESEKHFIRRLCTNPDL